MAPPIVRGRQLAKQRLGGIVFLVVLALLAWSAVALYDKAFTRTVRVHLRADRVGNQLSVGADVKARGVLVGRVASVRAMPDGADLELALDPGRARAVPASTSAVILPKTLFGEKFVALSYPGNGAGGRPLRDGAVIGQDRSSAARETSAALDDLLPVLRTLQPEQLSATLNAVSSALRGRGERIGANLQLTRDYLARLNPQLPTLAQDNAGVADLADTLTAAEPDLRAVLEGFAAVNRNLAAEQAALDTLLRSTTGAAGTLRQFTAENADRFVTLARDSVPALQLYARYSPQYPCLLDGINRQLPLGEAFGGLQPGLHITLEQTRDNGGYLPGDEPEYFDDPGPTCYGLTGPPVVPFPFYRDAADGYRDGQPVNPGTGTNEGPPPSGPGGPYTYPDQRRKAPGDAGSGSGSGSGSGAAAAPFSPASYDRAAVGAVAAPALQVAPDQVPGVAVLLFAPVARGTVVHVA